MTALGRPRLAHLTPAARAAAEHHMDVVAPAARAELERGGDAPQVEATPSKPVTKSARRTRRKQHGPVSVINAATINKLHDEAVAFGQKSTSSAKACGDMLIKMKATMAHGEWLPWLKEHITFSESTAQAYMKLAAGWDQLKPPAAGDLTLQGALKLLAAPAKTKAKTKTKIKARASADGERTLEPDEVGYDDLLQLLLMATKGAEAISARPAGVKVTAKYRDVVLATIRTLETFLAKAEVVDLGEDRGQP
jgi:hypothetical protein